MLIKSKSRPRCQLKSTLNCWPDANDQACFDYLGAIKAKPTTNNMETAINMLTRRCVSGFRLRRWNVMPIMSHAKWTGTEMELKISSLITVSVAGFSGQKANPVMSVVMIA